MLIHHVPHESLYIPLIVAFSKKGYITCFRLNFYETTLTRLHRIVSSKSQEG
jgi:hypothetical protein